MEPYNKVMMFIDGNYVYKCLEEGKNNFYADDLFKLSNEAYLKLKGNKELRRIYYYNAYPPLESDKSKRESVDKLIWQIENKTKLSLKQIQTKIQELLIKHTLFADILKNLNITEQEFEAQKLRYESSKQMKFYEKLQYKGFKVILKKLKKDDKGKYYQKGIDIYIASDMLSLAFEGAYDIAILLSGDADFIEVINKIQEKGKLVYLASFESGKSWELQRICDGFIGLDDIFSSLKLKATESTSKNTITTIREEATELV